MLLETGLRIVGIGALSANGIFPAVVRPGVVGDAAIHEIEQAELAQGPSFPVAWARFVEFAEGLAMMAVQENSDSDNDDMLLGKTFTQGLARSLRVGRFTSCDWIHAIK